MTPRHAAKSRRYRRYYQIKMVFWLPTKNLKFIRLGSKCSERAQGTAYNAWIAGLLASGEGEQTYLIGEGRMRPCNPDLEAVVSCFHVELVGSNLEEGRLSCD